MSKIYCGCDNGVTGTIGILGEEIEMFCKTPIKKEQDYTKKKKIVSRLDVVKFISLFNGINKNDLVFILERPMINGTRFNASMSAIRCHEAMLNCIEVMGCKLIYVDSKEWQKELLPKGCAGDELKKASLDIGNRLYPKFCEIKHPDRDGLLIAEYARKKNL
jgi:hypothetical protein|nr:MAG TPA: Monokaryotic chloroplast 1 junction resolvase, DNA BINDING.86A [Bacteriophage sp.]